MCAVQLLRVSVHERMSAAAEDFLLQVEKGEEEAEVPPLRALLTERLTAAAEEIVALFEETVAEYEDRVERSEREICRQRRLLDAVLKPEVKLHRAEAPADVQQLVSKEELPPEQQEWSAIQEDTEPPHIKEEQEELWSSQEGKQLQGLEEVKEEDKPQTGQEEENRDSVGPDRLLQPVSEETPSTFSVAEIEVSCDDWEELEEPPSASTCESTRCSSPDKAFSCSQCGKTFTKNRFLETHVRTHTGEKVFSCSVCGKKYTKKGYLMQHMGVHGGERPHSCSICNKRFVWRSGVECHKCVGGVSQLHPVPSSSAASRCNADRNPVSSSECDKRLCYSHHLNKDTGSHAESLFSCSVCGRRFTQRGYLIQHMARHTEKVRFRCCLCDKKFAWRHELKSHTCNSESSQADPSEESREAGGGADGEDSDSDRTSDSSELETRVTDEAREAPSGRNALTGSDVRSSTDTKSFVCSECGKTFCGEENLKTHMKTHVGEKPFRCSFCEKGFTQHDRLSAHSEEKRFRYCVCGKRFAWRYNLKKHTCDREDTPLHSGQTEPNREAEPQGTPHSSKHQTEADVCRDTSKRNKPVLESGPEEKPFSCSQCGKRFRRKKNLQEHTRIHTGEKPYGCSVCMRYFSCSGSLRKHMRIHTGEKPFSCSECGNRFTESGHLKVHMRTHTGEKPFSCSVCGKSFTWRQSFNNHMKYHTEAQGYRSLSQQLT